MPRIEYYPSMTSHQKHIHNRLLLNHNRSPVIHQTQSMHQYPNHHRLMIYRLLNHLHLQWDLKKNCIFVQEVIRSTLWHKCISCLPEEFHDGDGPLVNCKFDHIANFRCFFRKTPQFPLVFWLKTALHSQKYSQILHWTKRQWFWFCRAVR